MLDGESTASWGGTAILLHSSPPLISFGVDACFERAQRHSIKASTFHSLLTLCFPCRLPHSQLALWGSVIVGCAALIAASPLFYEMMVLAARRRSLSLSRSLAISQIRFVCG